MLFSKMACRVHRRKSEIKPVLQTLNIEHICEFGNSGIKLFNNYDTLRFTLVTFFTDHL